MSLRDSEQAQSDRDELTSAVTACKDAVSFALAQLAREVELHRGNPGLAQTQAYADDLIDDMAYDAFAKIDERLMWAGMADRAELRRQGVG